MSFQEPRPEAAAHEKRGGPQLEAVFLEEWSRSYRHDHDLQDEHAEQSQAIEQNKRPQFGTGAVEPGVKRHE
jgi:hypothetical protein